MKILKISISIAITVMFLVLTPILAFAKTVIPGGTNIGIEMRNEGLLVSGTYEIKVGNISYDPSKNSDIRKGDVILKVDNVSTKSIQSLVNVIKNLPSNTTYVDVLIKRNDKNLNRKLNLNKSDNGSWKSGLYIKERLLGIGTVTYYDPENLTYGALGHEIIDSDNGRIFDLSSGTIFESDVKGVKKSENGNPGEKIADIKENNKIGNITINNRYGIFGEYQEGKIDDNITMETATKDQVKLGKAEIWTVVKGSRVEKFEIEITTLRPQKNQDIKGITFRVTDSRLLSLTNGVIQGMSGSPIIQNNLLVGAVTHVVIDNVNVGHGIYIDSMIAESQKVR